MQGFQQLRRGGDQLGVCRVARVAVNNLAQGVALRTGLYLAQAGEFGFVLLSLGAQQSLIAPQWMTPVLASMVLSMLATPFVVLYSDRIVLRLRMEAHFEADAPSANVVGEWRGREKPDEVVVIGGHIDSWDVGAGASDDGGGIVSTWEAVRLMKALGLRPRRTVRVVLWTNEENGDRGGQAYRDQHRTELAKTVMMLEADSGLFTPVSFAVTANDLASYSEVLALTYVACDAATADVARLAALVQDIGMSLVPREVTALRVTLLPQKAARVGLAEIEAWTP